MLRPRTTAAQTWLCALQQTHHHKMHWQHHLLLPHHPQRMTRNPSIISVALTWIMCDASIVIAKDRQSDSAGVKPRSPWLLVSI
mmetsp:Transcript_20123/g.22275  ORF Transcript_20123/g.22275 Transcript_20123/m.22275 type:complete len:84 (-) Transcript_20123:2199-2450(-)